MAEFLSIETRVSEAKRMLDELGIQSKNISKQLLRYLAGRMKTYIRRGYRKSGLNKRSGDLYKSISSRLTKDGKFVIISPTARRDGKVLYGYALAKGVTIKPRLGTKALHFKSTRGVEPPYRRARSVVIKKNSFIKDSATTYRDTKMYADANAKLEKLVKKAIEKYESKQ